MATRLLIDTDVLIDDLRQEEDEEGTEARTEHSNLGRVRRGLRTREEAYYRPILEALDALGARRGCLRFSTVFCNA